MWKLEDLQDRECVVNINGKWVPARPLNFQKEHAGLRTRIKNAWAVFTCKAEAFVWPEGQ